MAPRPISPSRLWCCAMAVVAITAPWSGAQETRPTRTEAPIIVSEQWDAKTCLVAARTALARGDLEAAEALAVQAENKPRGLIAIIHSRWLDTPAKVFRAIAAARARQQAALIKDIQPRDTGKPDEPQPTPARAAKVTIVKAQPSIPLSTSVSEFTLAPAPRNASVVAQHQRDFFGSSSVPNAHAPKEAIDYLMDGVQAFRAGDAATILTSIAQAKKHRQDATWSKDNIDRLVAYLHDARGTDKAASGAVEMKLPATVAHGISSAPVSENRGIAGDKGLRAKSRSNLTGDEESEPSLPRARPTPRRGLAGEWLALVIFAFGLYLAARRERWLSRGAARAGLK